MEELKWVVYLVSIFPVGSVSRLGELHDKQQNIGKGSFVKISRLHRFPDYKYRFRDCFGFQVRCWIPGYQLAVTSRLLSSGQYIATMYLNYVLSSFWLIASLPVEFIGNEILQV